MISAYYEHSLNRMQRNMDRYIKRILGKYQLIQKLCISNEVFQRKKQFQRQHQLTELGNKKGQTFFPYYKG